MTDSRSSSRTVSLEARIAHPRERDAALGQDDTKTVRRSVQSGLTPRHTDMRGDEVVRVERTHHTCFGRKVQAERCGYTARVDETKLRIERKPIAGDRERSRGQLSTARMPIAPFWPWPNPWLTNGNSPGTSQSSSKHMPPPAATLHV